MKPTIHLLSFTYIFLLVTGLSFTSCKQKEKEKKAITEVPDSIAGTWKDFTLPVDQRVDMLVEQMTLEEKVSQMLHEAPAIPRLGIPAYNWWNECLHGVARAGIATVFPQAIGLGATWDSAHIHQVATIISDEARAKHHEALRKNERGIYQGLTMWSPNINIFRDPRWGRGHETYGEDPYLTSCIGVAFVKGLQGNNPNYLKAIATPKHYAVHSGPEPERHEFNAIADKRDLWDTYLPAFEATVKKANALSIMCAYNRYNGEACCGSSFLLQDILRQLWGFNGYVVSDCGAVRDISEFHKVVDSDVEGAALAVKSGTDLNCGSKYHKLIEAVKNGHLKEEQIDIAVKRLFTARIQLGMFDPPEIVPYAQIPYEVNDSPKHDSVALETARKSMVLLKNDNNFLPLQKEKLRKIAVIGPNADALEVLLGNYNGTPSNPVTPLQGIKNAVGNDVKIVYEVGCNLAGSKFLLRQVPEEFLSTGNKSGLKAEYFDNANLEGTPFYSQNDKTINSNWENQEIENLNIETFSVRWTGQISVPETGEYAFGLKGDDGFRLFINDKLLIEDWEKQAPETKTCDIKLEKGKKYKLKVEFFQDGGGMELSFKYALKSGDPYKKAVEVAEQADVVLFFGGLSPHLEGEEMKVDIKGFQGGDRTEIALPGVQTKLLKKIKQVNENIALVLLNGSALAINWENENIPAILEAWYPGQRGGTAIADILFGNYNPAGRLPVTFYQSTNDLPPFRDYTMKGKTYRYFTGEPLYAFGHGLSYSQFEYKNITITPKTTKSGGNINLTFNITNTGNVAGDEVPQVYIKDVESSVERPLMDLRAFKRIHLNPEETKTVKFQIPVNELGFFDPAQQKYIVEPGKFKIMVGKSSDNIVLIDEITIAEN